MYIDTFVFKFLAVTGIILVLFSVSFSIHTQEVFAAQVSTNNSASMSLLDRIFAQMSGVVSFSAQAIQAVADFDIRDLVSSSKKDETQNDSEAVSKKGAPESDASILIPKLPSTDSGSLVINVPLTVTDRLTIQGQSTFDATTVHGLFVATTKAELNSLLVRGKTELENLGVAGITDLNVLNVLGRATLLSLRVSSDAEVVGILTARGGIKTNGADVDLAEGRLYASNIINSLTAGSNITISGTPNAPIISAKKSGSSHPDLAAVRMRGGCAECITDSDVVSALTIAGGSINSSAIGLSAAAAAAFTNVTVGTTSATSTLEVNGAFVLNGLLTVLGTATSTFDGGINVTGGCVSVNGVCLGGGVFVLDDLADVNAPTPNAGQIFMFNGSDWINAATSTLGIGGADNLIELDDVLLSTSTLGDLLSYNGTEWVNVATSTLGIGADNLTELDDVLLSTSTLGDLLSYNGTKWINIATSTLGLGDGSFLGLRDTPSSYIANALSYVNATSSALTQSSNLVFTATGLGIGTSTPINKLSVAGTVGVLGQQALRFYNGANTNYVGFRASSTLSTNVLWSLPVSDGGVDEILVTDGVGNLRFANVSSVGGGSNTFLGLSDTANTFINKAVPFVSSSSLAFSTGLVFDGTHLGIGNTSPTSALTVQGDVRFQSGTSTVGFLYDNATNRVGIGTTNPTEKLVLEGGSFLQRGAASGDSYTPTLVGSLNLSANTNDVQVVGLFAYVVSNTAGNDFHVIDISDPSAPVELGSINLSDGAAAVYVAGKYAYVTTNATGNDFHVIDISDPSNPIELGSIDLSDGASDVFVLGQYAYVTTIGGGNDFHIIDITDPSLPRAVGSLSMSTGLNTVTVSGAYAYVGGDSVGNGFFVVDVSDPQNPTQTGTINLSVDINDISVQGRYAYIAAAGATDHFRIIDINDPSLPIVSSTLTFDSTANSVYVTGRYAYVAISEFADTFAVIDISTAAAPVQVGSMDLATGNVFSVAVYGRYAYLTSASAGNDFHIIDITGVEAQSAFVHSLESGTLSTLGNVSVGGITTISQAVRVGLGGIQTDGALFVQGTGSSFVKNKLGIGTTTPLQELSVAGDLQVTGRIYDSANSAGSNGMVLKSTGTGFVWVATSSLGIIGGSGLAATDIDTCSEFAAIMTGETGTCGSLVLSASPTFTGTVNAAAVTLSSTLTVSAGGANITGTTTATGHILPGANDLYDLGSTAFRFRDLYLGGETIHIGTSLTDEGTFGYNTTSNILNIGTDSTSNGDIAFFTNNLYIDKSSANIGLGTTTPKSKLTAYGDVFLEGTSRYINFGTAVGTSSYGIRDNAGTLQYKNSGGTWKNIADTVTYLTGVYTYDTPTTTETWIKPVGLSYVTVEVWGAGGGNGTNGSTGNGGGGGGGGYAQSTVVASNLGSTVTVDVGEAGYEGTTRTGGIGYFSGGTGGTGGGGGGGGGSSAFGTFAIGAGGSGGGGGGNGGGGGGGGGISGIGSNGSNGDGGNGGAAGAGVTGIGAGGAGNGNGAGSAGSAYGGGGGGAGLSGFGTGGAGGSEGGGEGGFDQGGGGGGGGGNASGQVTQIGGGGAGGTRGGNLGGVGGKANARAGVGGTTGTPLGGQNEVSSTTIPGGKGSIGDASNNGAVILYEYTATTSTGADLAEMYPVVDASIQAGDIVSFEKGLPITVGRADTSEVRPLAGIISSNPGLVLAQGGGINQRPVALSGRVPTKVNLEGGPITIGDRIALSSVPGVGKKATAFEDSVGIAIDSFGHIGDDTDTQGKVTVFIDLQQGIDIESIGLALLNQATSTASSTSSFDFIGSILVELSARLGFNDAIQTATIASSTASTSISSDITQDTIWTRLSSLAHSFVDGVLTIVGIHAEEVTTDKLCVGLTCVTESQLKSLLLQDTGNQNTTDSSDDSNDVDEHTSNTSPDQNEENSNEVEDTSDQITPPGVTDDTEVDSDQEGLPDEEMQNSISDDSSVDLPLVDESNNTGASNDAPEDSVTATPNSD